MTSAARQKIDTFTRQMFDEEVDKPKHDQVLTALFNDRKALEQILLEFHGVDLLQPFAERKQFTLRRTGLGGDSVVEREEALNVCGGPRELLSQSPLRLVKKELECLLNYRPEEGKASRLMGFIDIALLYDVIKDPFVVKMTLDGSGAKYDYAWSHEAARCAAFFEVKSEWPTAGNLIRQLNLYRSCMPRGFPGERYDYFLVGPDDSMNALANEHGYRLITFTADAKHFTLQPRVWNPPKKGIPQPF